MKRTVSYLILTALTLVASMGCDNKNNRSAAIRTPQYGQGYYFNQPYYQNCGQSNYQYMNPYNNTQMNCQFGANGLPQFYNQQMQPYLTDMYGNPCLTMQIDPMTGYCMNYQYYPMSYY
ncbi:MAG: hypothetical protein A4S09_08445 [Proteobacteria bacterium SG_bin7]|nr:MAG: hypothetical protein A4S09_08445 [Proteobacteria bacterium SG_bin7]